MSRNTSESGARVKPARHVTGKPLLNKIDQGKTVACNIVTWISTLCFGVRGDVPHFLCGHMGNPLSTLYSVIFDLTGTSKDATTTFKGIMKPSKRPVHHRLHSGNTSSPMYEENYKSGLITRSQVGSKVFRNGLTAAVSWSDFIDAQWDHSVSPYSEKYFGCEQQVNHINHDIICNLVIDILSQEQLDALSSSRDELQDKHQAHPSTRGYQHGGFDFNGDTVTYHHGWTMKGAWILQMPGFWNFITQPLGDYIKPKSTLKIFRKVKAYGEVPSRDVKEGDQLKGKWPTMLSRFSGNNRPLMNLADADFTEGCFAREDASFADFSEMCEMARVIAMNSVDRILGELGMEDKSFTIKSIVLALPIVGCMIASDRENSPTPFGGETSDLESERLTFVETQGDLSIQAKSEFGQKYKTPRLVKDASVLIPADEHSWTWARWRILSPLSFTWNLWKCVEGRKARRLYAPNRGINVHGKARTNDSWFSTQMKDQMEKYGMRDTYTSSDLLPILWNDFTTQVSTIRIVPAAIDAVIRNLALHYTEVLDGKVNQACRSATSVYGIEKFLRIADMFRVCSRHGQPASWQVGIPLFGYTAVKKAAKASAKAWDPEGIVHTHYGRHRILTKPRISQFAKSSTDQTLNMFHRKLPKFRQPKTPQISAFRRKGTEKLDMLRAMEEHRNHQQDIMEDLS